MPWIEMELWRSVVLQGWLMFHLKHQPAHHWMPQQTLRVHDMIRLGLNMIPEKHVAYLYPQTGWVCPWRHDFRWLTLWHCHIVNWIQIKHKLLTTWTCSNREKKHSMSPSANCTPVSTHHLNRKSSTLFQPQRHPKKVLIPNSSFRYVV